MTFPLRTTALATLLVSTALPAMAEITAEEVWADWQRLLADATPGLTVGSERKSGDTLVVTDAAIAVELEDGSGTFTTVIPELRFEEQGDGTVEIRFSPEYRMDIEGTDAATDEDFAATLTIRQSGFVTIASRDGNATRYDYLAPELSIALSNLTVDEEEVDFTLLVGATGTSGSYTLTEGAPREFTSAATTETLTVSGSGQDTDDPSASFSITASMADVSSNSSGTVAGLAGMNNMAAMFDAGFRQDFTLTHGEASYTISGSDAESLFNLESTVASGSFDGSLSPEGLSYGGGNTDVEVAISASDIPFPQINLSMAESEGRLTMPVRPADESSDYGLTVRMIDLEVSEAIWGMFDPAGQLPRNPASLVIDLSGKARLFFDMFDPEAAENMDPDAVPGEVENLTINALQLSVAGAELTGDGAFVFDNSPTGPFAPAPSPSGTANLELTGGNTLLDTLVGMGLVPQEQAMGARMMLGLFARPGDGPDTLTSTIEVGTDGSVSANGQRIR